MLDTTTAYGTGRRKRSIARTWISPGDGQLTVNNVPLKEYFVRHMLIEQAIRPLIATQLDGQVDIKAFVQGGGIAGQADALRHAIANALVDMDDAHRGVLGPLGLLTRDPRARERKKPFCRGARRRKQFSKR